VTNEFEAGSYTNLRYTINSTLIATTSLASAGDGLLEYAAITFLEVDA